MAALPSGHRHGRGVAQVEGGHHEDVEGDPRGQVAPERHGVRPVGKGPGLAVLQLKGAEGSVGVVLCPPQKRRQFDIDRTFIEFDL